MKAFTIIELLITILIMSILLLMSFPALHHLVMNNRSTAEVNTIVSALQYARSEAIKNEARVKFCKSSDHRTCGGNWRDGQIVINANNGKVLRVFPALAHGDKLIWNSSLGKDDYIEFSAIGYSEQRGSFTYCPNGEKQYAQAIIISQSGRIRVAEK